MKEKLLSVTKDDLRVDTFRSGGKGGQHQNKTNSGVRITHIASGAVGESREERDQLQNKKTAFKRMLETTEFKNWMQIEIARKLGTLSKIEAEVDRSMLQVKVESHDEQGRWVEGLTNPEE